MKTVRFFGTPWRDCPSTRATTQKTWCFNNHSVETSNHCFNIAKHTFLIILYFSFNVSCWQIVRIKVLIIFCCQSPQMHNIVTLKSKGKLEYCSLFTANKIRRMWLPSGPGDGTAMCCCYIFLWNSFVIYWNTPIVSQLESDGSVLSQNVVYDLSFKPRVRWTTDKVHFDLCCKVL
jgi:hypothetical protein